MTCGHADRSWQEAGTSFIGSMVEAPGHGLIVLRGEIDAPVVDRLGSHIDQFLVMDIRFLMMDATAVDSYGTTLLDLLGRTQRRLGWRRGWLRVRGLHPALLEDPVQEALPEELPPPTSILSRERARTSMPR